MKLDIGSGDSPISGYTGVDKYATSDSVIKADMWDLPFDDSSVDSIYSSHALEHVERWRVVPTLQEWYRVLKPGGTLDLRVPDILWCINHYLHYVEQYETEHNPVLGWELSILIGSQEPGMEGMIHRMAFTEKSLKYFLTICGFSQICIEKIWSHSQQTLRATAVK